MEKEKGVFRESPIKHTEDAAFGLLHDQPTAVMSCEFFSKCSMGPFLGLKYLPRQKGGQRNVSPQHLYRRPIILGPLFRIPKIFT